MRWRRSAWTGCRWRWGETPSSRVASQCLPAYASDAADWKKRHAALICLSQIAEGCSKVGQASLMIQV